MRAKRSSPVAAALFALLPCAALYAAPVDAETAQSAAKGWLAESCGETSPAASKAASYHVQGGSDSYYVVGFEGGGFVVMPGDDRLEPVLAFSEDGEWDASDADSPFAALLSDDIAVRRAEAERLYPEEPARAARLLAFKAQSAAPASPCAARWRSLAEKGSRMPQEAKRTAFSAQSSGGSGGSGSSSSGPAKPGLSSLADVRRRPFVNSKWGQSTAAGGFLGLGIYPCFNLYTPNSYPCGCAATAMAQTMRYFRWPTASVAKSKKTCYVDGKAYSFIMLGGKYDWASMPLSWSLYTTQSERNAMGHLAYDCAVSVGAYFTPSGSGATIEPVAKALKSNFKYAHAVCRSYSKSVAKANMDASSPVVLSMYGSGYRQGHAVVLDGYAYDSAGTLYFHMNAGWNGKYNLWYNSSPAIVLGEGGEYSEYGKMVCNIFPKGSAGALLTGRVLDASGNPSSGATVRLYDANGKAKSSAATDSSGIYFFRVTDKKSYSVRARRGEVRSAFAKTSVSLAKSGMDLALTQSVPKRTVTWNLAGGSMEEAGARQVLEEDAVGDLPVPSRKGYSFKGWYTAKSGGKKISSSTKIVKNVTFYARWAIRKYQVSANASGKGNVSGSAKKNYNSTVTLKAVPSKGYVLQGWYDKDGQLVSRKASFKVKVPAANVAYTARFISAAQDKAGIRLAVGGALVGSWENAADQVVEALPPLTSVCGVFVKPVSVASGGLTSTGVSFAGLPAGLKYDSAAKAVKGVPSASGVFTVKAVVKSAGASRTWSFKWTVEKLPAFASGTFNGFSYRTSGGAEQPEPARKVTFSVTSAGKMSAKVGTLVFSRTGWTVGEDGLYRAVLSASRTVGSGSGAKKYKDVLTVVLQPVAMWFEDQISATLETFAAGDESAPLNGDTLVLARRNPFGDCAEAKAVAKELASRGADAFTDGYGTAWRLAVSQSGIATISRTTGTGKNKKTVSAASTVVLEPALSQDSGPVWRAKAVFEVSGRFITVDFADIPVQ